MARDAIATIENTHVEEAYARWAPVYDLVFAAVMKPGRKAAAAAASRDGGRVLDVGVGTGLELPMFTKTTRLVGVDLSEPMLQRAQERVTREGLSSPRTRRAAAARRRRAPASLTLRSRRRGRLVARPRSRRGW